MHACSAQAAAVAAAAGALCSKQRQAGADRRVHACVQRASAESVSFPADQVASSPLQTDCRAQIWLVVRHRPAPQARPPHTALMLQPATAATAATASSCTLLLLHHAMQKGCNNTPTQAVHPPCFPLSVCLWPGLPAGQLENCGIYASLLQHGACSQTAPTHARSSVSSASCNHARPWHRT